jgi:ABC-type multidrug transport system ATPase subunit
MEDPGGRDVVGEPLAVRRRIGLAGEFAAVDEELTGRESLEMIRGLSETQSDVPASALRRRPLSIRCPAGPRDPRSRT